MNQPKPHKHDRLTSYIKESSAEFIQKESNGKSLITVTDVMLSNDNKRATILVSVLPATQEPAVLDFLKRNISELRAFISNKTKIGVIPFLDVKIDFGEKNRQRLDEISNSL